MPPRARPMSRGKPLARAGSLSPASRKRLAEALTRQRARRMESFPRPACLLIDARDQLQDHAEPYRCCQRCGTTRDLHRHHRRGKAAGGSSRRAHTHCPCNAVTLCGECHRWAHTKGRALAQEQGFVVSQAVTEPATAGVLRFAADGGTTTWWPSCSGQWLAAAPRLLEAA